MKILIDIMHIPHINFFKNLVALLKENGEEVSIICLNRGKNLVIANEEFEGIRIHPIGRHRGNFLSIIIEANIIRFFLILKYCLLNKPDIGISVSGFVTGFVLKILISCPARQNYVLSQCCKCTYFDFFP